MMGGGVIIILPNGAGRREADGEAEGRQMLARSPGGWALQLVKGEKRRNNVIWSLFSMAVAIILGLIVSSSSSSSRCASFKVSLET